MLRRLLLCGAMVAIAGCTLDTELPRPPPLGAVTGSVDTQGKVPPEGVAVTLISSTGARQTTTTAAAGRFDFAQVTNGQYFLEVKQPGFVTLVVPGVVVRPRTSNSTATTPSPRTTRPLASTRWRRRARCGCATPSSTPGTRLRSRTAC